MPETPNRQQEGFSLSLIRERFDYVDRKTLFSVLSLMLLSVVAVYSASSPLSYVDGQYSSRVILSHIKMLLGSCGTLLFVTALKPRIFAKLSTVGMIVSLVLVALTFVMGTTLNNASRWLSIMGFSFQPSEIGKVALIIYVARQLAVNENEPRKAFWHCIAAIGLMTGMVLIHNLSTAILIAVSSFSVLIVSKLKWSYIISTIGVGVAIVAIAIAFSEPLKDVLPKRFATWSARVERFMSDTPDEDDDGNYQSKIATMAVSTGGLMGVGPGNSRLSTILPMAFSDFIFVIILEEWGIVGGGIILLLYFFIFARSRIIALQSRKPFHLYTVFGLTWLLVLQALVNMSVGVGIIPVTGQTLPFVSMGGTSNIVCGVLMGVVLSIGAETRRAMALETKGGQKRQPKDKQN